MNGFWIEVDNGAGVIASKFVNESLEEQLTDILIFWLAEERLALAPGDKITIREGWSENVGPTQ